MIIYKGMESVAFATIPYMPNKGAMLEEFAVLFKELVAKPVVKVCRTITCCGQQFFFFSRRPVVTKSRSKSLPKAICGGILTPHRGDADNAIIVGKIKKVLAFLNPFSLKISELHFLILLSWPAISEQTGNSNLKSLITLSRMTVKNPLSGVVGMRLWKAVPRTGGEEVFSLLVNIVSNPAPGI